MPPNPTLAGLARAVGTWRTTGTHPYLPGRTLQGHAEFAWTEDGAFLALRTVMRDPEIPAGRAVFGGDDAGGVRMLYYDVRGVARIYDVTLHEDGFAWSRDAPGFRQRFRVTVARDGQTMEGRGEMSRDGAPWEKDLDLTYHRIPETRS
jgi:hypothetical protein